MNEKQLRYIEAIARTQSIQSASALLGKNSSTLTRTLKKVEQDFNIRLFRRPQGGLTATAEGAVFLSFARDILKLCGELKQAAPGGQTCGHDLTENEIRYLLAIREMGSISQAAQELFIAQPSLSQILTGLEQDYGCMVFERSGQGVEPTAGGLAFLEKVQEIGELFRRLRIEMEEFQDLEKGTFTFGIPQNLGAYLLPVVLPAFNRRYPGIQVHFKENNSTELDKLLLTDKTDFSIMHFQEANESLAYEAFFRDPFYLVVPVEMSAGLGLPEQRYLTAEDIRGLRNIPFVMVAARQKLRQVADSILDQSGLRPEIRYVTKSMETAKRLAAAGMGVTFLPYSYLTLYSGMEGLACYQLDEGLGASWELVAAYPKKGRLSRSAREFLRILKECLVSMEP